MNATPLVYTTAPLSRLSALSSKQVGGQTYQKLANAINTFRGWRVRGGTSEVVSRVRSVRISPSYYLREAGWSVRPLAPRTVHADV